MLNTVVLRPGVEYFPIAGHTGSLPNGHTSVSQQPHLEASLESSQPVPVVQDTALLRPEQQDRPEACPELLVMDLRSYTASLGNRAKGGGCECTGEH